ncbi:hypothetical protein LCGC14_1097160 [marine sediment metagenome]|uniref:Uncharacterized protein n=1 Tax=marine sediment metagenome TaxID=412755 RepID=A0A0F9MF13_9ZZZZ
MTNKNSSIEEIRRIFESKDLDSIVDLMLEEPLFKLHEAKIVNYLNSPVLKNGLIKHVDDEFVVKLLEKLEMFGIINSQEVKHEIVKRFASGNPDSILTLFSENFYNRLNKAEISQTIETMNYTPILSEEAICSLRLLGYLIDLGDLYAEELFRKVVFKNLEDITQVEAIISYLTTYNTILSIPHYKCETNPSNS